MKEGKIVKVCVVRTDSHTYYVQQMPGFYGMGIDYVVMKDRRVLHADRFKSAKLAVGWLLAYLCRELTKSAELLDENNPRYLNI